LESDLGENWKGMVISNWKGMVMCRVRMMCLFTAWRKNFEYPWQPPKIRTKFDTPIVLVYKVITNFTFYNILPPSDRK
jgi:hypothetical protein